MSFEFKKLEIKDERPWYKKLLASPQAKRTALFAVLGALAGMVYFYLSEGKYMNEILAVDLIRSGAVGSAFGIFITNSPCARGRC